MTPPLVDTNAGLTPCDFLIFLPKIDKNAGLTPCDCFRFFFMPKWLKMLDLPLVIFSIFLPKIDKNAGLTPCDLFYFLAQNGLKCWTYPL